MAEYQGLTGYQLAYQLAMEIFEASKSLDIIGNNPQIWLIVQI